MIKQLIITHWKMDINLNKLVLILIFILLAQAAFSQELYMSADRITFDRVTGAKEALGNVIAWSKGLKITALRLKYYPKEGRVYSDDMFTMQRDGIKIFGYKLNYNINTMTGTAGDVRVEFRSIYLGGNYIRIYPERVDILNGYFSACDQPATHYHIASNNIVVNPKTGLVIALWAVFWIDGVPTIPVPAFLYTAEEVEEKEKPKAKAPPRVKKRAIDIISEKRKNMAPIAEIGSNDEDGLFINQRLPYFFSPFNFGKLNISYAEKKKLGIYLLSNYVLNDWNDGMIRIGNNTIDEYFGGITHVLSFGSNLTDKERLAYDIYEVGKRKAYEAVLSLSYRERINLDKNAGPFDRVSFLPNFTLRANRRSLYTEDLKYSGEISIGAVSEETTSIRSSRLNLKGDIAYNFDLWNLGSFGVSFADNYTDYGESGSWHKFTQNLSVYQNWGALEWGVGHIHYIIDRGFSPYAFETYGFSGYDELDSYLFLNIFYSRIGASFAHNLPSLDPKDLDYYLTVGLHCFDLIFSYRVMRKEFTFNVGLTLSKW